MKTRVARISVSLVAGAAALVAIGIAVLYSEWFVAEVRRQTVRAIEEATGGKVEIASFSFDWTHLRVQASGLKIHGTEGANERPFFAADRVELRLKLFPSWRRAIDLRYLGVEKPAVNILVFADGKTNIPTPRAARKRDVKSGLETVVDLAVGRFEIASGEIRFNGRPARFSAHGENLRAELSYEAARQGYRGSLSIDPLRIAVGTNPAIEATVELPIRIDKDGVRLESGRIATAKSQLTLNASLDHLASPVVNASADGIVSLEELGRTFAMPVTAAGAPSMARASVAVRIDGTSISVGHAHVTMGRSTLDASGPLKDAKGGGLDFRIHASLDELARLRRLPVQPGGTANVEGTVRAVSGGYAATGNAGTQGLSIRRGENEVRDAAFSAGFALDRDGLRLNDLRIAAFEGEFTGTASLEHFNHFTLDGRLHRYSLARLAELTLGKSTGYEGAISGSLHVEDNLKARGRSGLTARGALSVEAGGRGTPMSGEIQGEYNGASGQAVLTDSFLALPHSRLDVSGTVGESVRVRLVSRNLDDFLPAAAWALERPVKELPARLRGGGTLTVEGTVDGSIEAPSVAVHAAASGFSIEHRPFDRLSVDVTAGPSGASAKNGALVRKDLRANFNGSVGLTRWKTSPGSPLTLKATMDNADLADLLALAGQADAPYTGNLNARATIGGTVGNPQGEASLTVVQGSAYQAPFDRLRAHLVLSDKLVRLVSAEVRAGAAMIEASGTFTHPRDAWNAGALQVQVNGGGIGLAQIPTLATRRPGLDGALTFQGTASADVRQTAGGGEIEITGVNGEMAVHGIRDEALEYGDMTARARTAGRGVDFSLDSNLAGSKIQLSGRTALEGMHATEATASVSGLPVEKVLALAGVSNAPVRGLLRADAKVSGTWRDPRGEMNLQLTHAAVYDEKLDAVKATVRATETAIEVSPASVTAPAGEIAFSGSFLHPAGEYDTGRFQVHVASGGVDLRRVERAQTVEPGLSGAVHLLADVSGLVTRQREGPRMQVTKIDGSAKAENLAFEKQALGDAALEAKTNGDTLELHLDSNFAKSSIRGEAHARLDGDYPMEGQIHFANVTYSSLKFALGQVGGVGADFDAVTEGTATLSGPLLKPEALGGTLEIARLQLIAPRRGAQANGTFTVLSNQGPIRLKLDRSTLRIEEARLSGRDTNIALSGSIAARGDRPMDLTIEATVGLAILQDLNRDVYSSGEVVVRAAVRGTPMKPVAGGRIEFKNATVNIAGIPNGMSNLNGAVNLNGTSASIQKLSGETGGGKLAITGSVDFFHGNLRYGLKAVTEKVRLRYQGASILSDSTINLSGGAERGRISGEVTIRRVAFSAQSDIGSILARSSAPVETPSAETGPLQGVKLDVRIRTAPDVRFQTDYTQRLEAVADLNLRGTLARPSLLGRITVTQGDVIFFGNQYAVNQGSITFYNPLKIEPILNVSLETQSQGVDVTLGVTGPVDNMKLSYRSDPPLQFDEIVALLAAGRTPTSDPTLVAHQPAALQQSFGQMGESAIVSQAIASPVADRLQRVFGISQVKIDPAFVTGSALPEARLTLQQRITSNITFTYTTDLSQSNAQIVRVEWAIDPRYSAVATRDENGVVGFDIFFKKQFH